MQSSDIRLVPKEQVSELLDLWSFAFQLDMSAEDREQRIASVSSNEAWGAYVDGRLAAGMRILELQAWIQGKAFAMGGLASVATWPEYRRGRLVSRLLDNALRVMRENGQTVSFLHPFQFGFYRRFGWETYTEYKTYEIPVALLPKLEPQPGRMVRVGQDIELLHRIYSAYAARYNGSLVRSERWWKDRIFARKAGSFSVYYDAAGQPSGYVHYVVKERVLTVHELVALNHGARLAIWRFLADHDSMINMVKMSVPADDRLPFLLDNPRIKQELVPYFMARIVDVAAFLEKYPFASGEESTLLLDVKDAQAEWNDGLFQLVVDESGTARVEAAASDEKVAAVGVPRVSCDVQTLMAMLMSYQRPAFLHEIGRLEGPDEALETLERLIPVRQTYLPDYF
ncbi:GNAT family N-acetyltransferase [Paenibacillus cremeus]|uniref:GNAT family N-acetyltransferase n=1 Tax=Paenibacillus cremeus TaxID=2163881 RepID=A0A559K061_9BACL|nr:GNAT family N-acetyltransferase [Paenibacillus cremeus]TVY05542.1 GNAT family N-acetyltransferase [Paenibacillus cremeus]